MITENTEIIPEPEITPAEPPVWGGWATFGLGAAIFAVNTIVQTVVMAVVIIWVYSTREAPLAGDSLEGLLTYFSDLIVAYMGLIIALTTIVGMLVSVGMVLLLVKAKHGASVREYLALRPISVRTVLWLVGAVVLLVLFSDLASATVKDPTSQGFMFNSYGTSVWPALFWVALVVGAPIAEEVIFRGFLFAGFARSRLGLVGTIAITSLVWAAMHVQYEWQLIGSIFVIGVVFGYVRHRTRSLWATLLMHALINLVAMFQVAFGVERLLG
jgi:uncharacterized protein